MEILTEDKFWRAIFVLLRNQHAIQKKLSGVKITEFYKISVNTNIDFKTISKEDLDLFLKFNNIQPHLFTSNDNTQIFEDLKILENLTSIVIISKFILKKPTIDPEIGYQILDFKSKEYHCKCMSPNLNDYYIKFQSNDFEINLIQTSKKLKIDNDWCNYFFKPKFLKWTQNKINMNKQSTQSLSLINLEQYTVLYNELKNKYAKKIIDIWPESTDPLKFVHEDVAIAAYLIVFWKETKTEPTVNFVDLGCGNGLLVYILNSEGYSGYGIDVRRRKIWDVYPENKVKLIEHTIIPNDSSYSYNADWLIGNHSDELSPWIPIIAANNSFKCKFFLLPCCAYEFSGEKYQRRNSKNSTYNDFLEYVEIISEKCNFNILKDRLKIPSTKRISYIGISRNYEENLFKNKIDEVKSFIDTEINNTNIKLRNKIEIVQNCTQIDKTIQEIIILKIFNLILSLDNTLKSCDWNEGGKIQLQDIAKYLSQENLNQIKDQCGGLKTLLKNHHEIFLVQGNEVALRRPNLANKERLKKFANKRLCFFYLNHPNGCPLKSDECSFNHSCLEIKS